MAGIKTCERLRKNEVRRNGGQLQIQRKMQMDIRHRKQPQVPFGCAQRGPSTPVGTATFAQRKSAFGGAVVWEWVDRCWWLAGLNAPPAEVRRSFWVF
jgi:hypothetical protein